VNGPRLGRVEDRLCASGGEYGKDSWVGDSHLRPPPFYPTPVGERHSCNTQQVYYTAGADALLYPADLCKDG